MAELKEGSLLFSLDAWANRERQRRALAEAEAERDRALEQLTQVCLQRERLELELDAHRRRERARLDEGRRLRIEIERLDALRRAEVDRARREAEARAALELAARQKDHEQRLHELRASTARWKERVFLSCLALLLTLTAASFFAFMSLRTGIGESGTAHRGENRASRVVLPR